MVTRLLSRFLVPLGACALLAAASSGTTQGDHHTLRLDRAIAEQRALVAERGDASALSDLGNLLTMDGDTAGAEEAYRRALELAPDDPSIHLNYALLLQRLQRSGDALRELRATVELAPNYAWAHYQIGRILAARGERGQAVAAYARAFSLDPTLAFADSNPHVIENALAAEALLRSGAGALVEPDAAPRSYRDRERISSLLVGKGTKADPPAPAAASSPPPQAARPRLPAPERPSFTVPESESERDAAPPGAWRSEPQDDPPAGADARALSPRDLNALGNLNQATPSEGSPPPRVTPRRGALPPGAAAPGVVPVVPPGAFTVPGTPAPPTDFVPGRRSTAQVGIGLRAAQPAPGA